MRKPIWKYVQLVLDTLPIMEPIYEFGSYQVAEAPQDADLRPLLAGRDYMGCDMREGPGVDKVLNLHDIDLPDNCVGTVFLMDTLEHVEYPHRAVTEVHRILKPGGLVVMSSVLDFFIHETPNDFWRFTPDGFRSLLKPFAQSHVGWFGPDHFPQSIVGVGFKASESTHHATHATHATTDNTLTDAYHERYTVWQKKFTQYCRNIELDLMRKVLQDLDELP